MREPAAQIASSELLLRDGSRTAGSQNRSLPRCSDILWARNDRSLKYRSCPSEYLPPEVGVNFLL